MKKTPRLTYPGESIWNDLNACMPPNESTDYSYPEQFSLEREVLTAAVWNDKALPYVVEQMEPDDFASPVLRHAFTVIRDRFVEGEGVTTVLLRPLLHESAYAAIADSDTYYVSQLPDHCRQLRENTRVRALRRLGEQLVVEPGDSLETLLEEGMAKLVRRDGFRGLDMLEAGRTAVEARQNGGVSRSMVDFPWSKVNMCTRGMHAGWVCLLAGRPGHGKTAAAIEIAISAAKQGKKVLFSTLEMDAQELFVRVAQRFGLDTEHYYMGGMTKEDWSALDDCLAFEPLKNIRIEYADTIAKLTSLVRSTRPHLLIVDYVQLIVHDHRERVEGMTKTSHALKALARRYNIPVLGLSQLSRVAKDQRGKLPTLPDLRDSGALEQDADQVIFVWQHEDTTHNIVTGRGAFVVAKARMGKVGKQAFVFQGALQRFQVSS